MCEKSNPADTKVGKGEEGGGPDTGAEIVLQPPEKAMVMQNHGPPAAHGEPNTGAGWYVLKKAAVHGEAMQEQSPGRNYDLQRGAPAGAGFLAAPVTSWGIHARAVHS